MNPYAIHSLGIDPGFGSSYNLLTEHLQEHDTIRVLYARTIWRRLYSPRPSNDYK